MIRFSGIHSLVTKFLINTSNISGWIQMLVQQNLKMINLTPDLGEIEINH